MLNCKATHSAALRIYQPSSIIQRQREWTMYSVKLGNHRAVAVIILTKKNRITRNLTVGKIRDKDLTAGELVRLYDSKQLSTDNTNYRGIAWVDESKIEDIVTGFKADLLFDKNRDGGVGIEIKFGGRVKYQDVRIDFGHGDLLGDYLKKKWHILR